MENEISTILKRMTDQSEEVIFIFDISKLTFLYINDAIEPITLIRKDMFIKQPSFVLSIIHPDDLQYVQENLGYLLKREGNSLLNFRIIRPDNTERWVRVKVSPVFNEGKLQYLSGSAEDDTMRKTSIFNMQKVNGWKNSTLEILSHDLRSPIGTVQMLASAISKKISEEDHKDIRKLTAMIIDISKRNIDLIHTLLQKEILDTAQVHVSKERIDAVWEAHQVMDMYIKSQETIEKHFKLTSSHDKIYAEIDSMKFVQILNNLVSNAVKFTAEQGQIKVHLEKLEDSILITVSDNGIGIPKSLQPILFNKYTKAGREGLDGQSSVGLGMWIVKNLTEAHGGKIWFESEHDTGTTFYVEIPMGKSLPED